MAEKRKMLNDNLEPEEQRKKRKADRHEGAEGELGSNQQGIGASADGAGPSDVLRESTPKIFLSHSGAQTDFTEQLYVDLARYHLHAFFDKDPECLRKGDEFLPKIEKAAAQCRVAVLVLSKEYFKLTVWPMMELTMFVKALRSDNPDMKILSLFFGKSLAKFEKKVQEKHWRAKWKELASIDSSGSIKVDGWEDACQDACEVILKSNVIDRKGKREVPFRRKVVDAIRRLVKPDVVWDESNVRSQEKLCKPITQKFQESKPSDEYGVCVVGLHGMGGVGKTTISRVLCNQKFEEFDGKICHLEFVEGAPSLEFKKKVLQDLTHVSEQILCMRDASQLDALLKKHMRSQKVFLVLDNVCDEQIEEATNYLKAGYHVGSLVLVISRSLDILVDRLHIRKDDCLSMPNIDDKEDARDVLLLYVGNWDNKDNGSIDAWLTIDKYVEECLYKTKRVLNNGPADDHQYYPLALKTFGMYLRSTNVLDWEESLERFGDGKCGKSNKFDMLKELRHPIFSVLRVGYDALCQQEKHIFLDLALLLDHGSTSNQKMLNGWKWLRMMYNNLSENDIKLSVKALRRKGLLQNAKELENVIIHELYHDFAEVEVRLGPVKEWRFFIDRNGTNLPNELGKCGPCLERLIIARSGVQFLENSTLSLCANTEVMRIYGCEQLEEVDATGMKSLKCLEILEDGKRITKLEMPHNLVCLSWSFGKFSVIPNFFRDLLIPTRLQVLELRGLKWSDDDIILPDLGECTNLEEITLGNVEVGEGRSRAPRVFGRLPKSLLKIDFSGCKKLIGSIPVGTMSMFTKLQDLNLSGCCGIEDLEGLNELPSLQTLNLSGTSIFKLPDLGQLKNTLKYLDVSRCKHLESITEIVNATSLQRLDASNCEKLREVPTNITKLRKLKHVNLTNCPEIPREIASIPSRGLQIIYELPVDEVQN